MKQIKTRLKKYIGKSIVAIFIDPTNDWLRYRVIEVKSDRVHLRGEDNDHGSAHEGDSFWVDIDDIEYVWRVKN